MTAPLGRRRCDVVARGEHGAYVVLTVADSAGPPPRAGQFYMLMAAERWGGGEDERPFLPRAFSVLRARDGELEFMLEDVGPGTRRLCELAPGEALWILGPLGNGFEPPRPGRRAVLVGGGVGTAPLAILQDELTVSASGPHEFGPMGVSPSGPHEFGPPGDVTVLLGFRDAAHAAGAELLSDVRVATDDGSVGHHGYVTDLLAAEIDEGFVVPSSPARTSGPGDPPQVYACGPPPMLEAVRALCARHEVPVQLALESGMACGFGACYGCVVPTRSGYVRLCVDGPVLEGSQLEAVRAH